MSDSMDGEVYDPWGFEPMPIDSFEFEPYPGEVIMDESDESVAQPDESVTQPEQNIVVPGQPMAEPDQVTVESDQQITAQKVGSIIGRKGEFIKKMCEEAKARIKSLMVHQELRKELKVMVSAKEELDSSLPPAIDGLLKVHKRVVDGLDSDSSHAPPAGVKVTTRLLVPATQAGNLIGKQGTTVKSIQEDSSCIVRAGGAQAISAMAWGTESCPKVDKIYGPGNQYVTAAKMILQNSEAMISIDMPAGPSEVLVIADKHASPVHIAADLLSQAEHGSDSQVVLVITGDGVDPTVIHEEIGKQCQSLPRGDLALKALSHSFTVFARDMVEAINFSNIYAPEHLIINVKDAEKWESFIENAGSVFLGPWTPESVGEYASGTNHVLPTYGYARMYGGVSLDSFLKYITVQSLTEEGLRHLGPHVATMAEVEGLDAHKRAVTLRLQDIEAKQIPHLR